MIIILENTLGQTFFSRNAHRTSLPSFAPEFFESAEIGSDFLFQFEKLVLASLFLELVDYSLGFFPDVFNLIFEFISVQMQKMFNCFVENGDYVFILVNVKLIFL